MLLSVLIKGVNKCNLHLILEHLDPGLNLPACLLHAKDCENKKNSCGKNRNLTSSSGQRRIYGGQGWAKPTQKNLTT